MPGVRIATWNVNALTAERLERLWHWVDTARPDVLCLQETKSTDDAFPALDFHARGYDSVHHGQGRWNGVAIASRCGVADVVTNFGRPLRQARTRSTTCQINGRPTSGAKTLRGNRVEPTRAWIIAVTTPSP